MAKKPTSKEKPRRRDGEPKWLNGPIRTTPYTEEELAMFAEGFKEGLSDTVKWQELVNQVGEEKAERILKNGFIAQNPNAPHQKNIN